MYVWLTVTLYGMFSYPYSGSPVWSLPTAKSTDLLHLIFALCWWWFHIKNDYLQNLRTCNKMWAVYMSFRESCAHHWSCSPAWHISTFPWWSKRWFLHDWFVPHWAGNVPRHDTKISQSRLVGNCPFHIFTVRCLIQRPFFLKLRLPHLSVLRMQKEKGKLAAISSKSCSEM